MNRLQIYRNPHALHISMNAAGERLHLFIEDFPVDLITRAPILDRRRTLLQPHRRLYLIAIYRAGVRIYSVAC